MPKINYEKEQQDELEHISFWMVLNTIATVITGLATVILAIFALLYGNR